MSRKYKFRDQDKLHFVSFATVYWLDVFTRRIYNDPRSCSHPASNIYLKPLWGGVGLQAGLL